MFNRLRTKIIFSFCLLMVGGGALSTTLVSRTMAKTLGSVVDRTGAALATVVADQLIDPVAYGDRLEVRDLLTGVRESNPDVVYAFIADPSGTVRDHSFPGGSFPSDLLAIASSAQPITLRTESGPVRDLPLPVTQGLLGTLHLGISMAWVETATAGAVSNVLITTLVAMAAGIVGILFLASLITRPVLALRDAADLLGRGNFDAEAPVEGSDEIADLARTFNQMAGQIRDRIRESEGLRAYVERVLDQMESSIFVVSGNHQVEYANQVAIDRNGPLVDRACHEVMGRERPCDDCPVSEVLASGTVVKRRFQALSGRTYDLKWVPILGRTGSPEVVERAVDVTESLENRERLQRAQRLAVAGEIASGVVHSINNPLDGVRRALELADARPGDRERLARMLSLAKEGTDRIATITRTLLGFVRGDSVPRPVPVRVESLIESAVNLTRLKAEAGSVAIRTELEDGLPRIFVAPDALEEVLVSLLLNALDACEDGGRVTIRARTANDQLELSVCDSGPGVPSEQKEAVFEPFFTTKEAGRGTGLGLPVARRVVEAHGGDLVLEPGSGEGAEFIIRIPLTPQSISSEPEVV